MSEVRQQALIEAPVPEVWELIGDPRRYPEWWPRVIEVQGERFEEGDEYVQVTRSAMGSQTTTFLIDHLDDLREIRMHCTASGTFAHWRLTDAQGGTFVDVQMGMDPISLANRVFDRTVGKRFFRGWMAESVAALRRVSGPTTND